MFSIREGYLIINDWHPRRHHCEAQRPLAAQLVSSALVRASRLTSEFSFRHPAQNFFLHREMTF